ncbi:tRNA (adenosine(37)-N6)-dimethylallyltransferase MiaA [Patescibacteria group bacterium]|nr:tRNA (adenosine(37)-N6)-dimethylallyltransferase MiaA [Patescibacteria group bacterium]MCH8888857.1 tRNA (adenosine(37)-N6)-dimethylallyltransferase MiaA [Patescibacteria group bacterium]
MSNKKQKILVVVGPTASGKTRLSISLAKKFNGEIISADSRQVYKGLNIGTEKASNKEMQGIPHHLIDVCDPSDTFTVRDFKKHAKDAIREIASHSKLPIVTGGSGFYIDALLYKIDFPEVLPNKSLRKELEHKSKDELFTVLEEKDPERAKTIDPHNKRRLIRALEIIEKLGSVPEIGVREGVYDTLIIGIKTSDHKLKEKIEERFGETMEKGLINEIMLLRNNGISDERINEFGLEYRVGLEFLNDDISEVDMRERIIGELWKYVKRQKTWFKRNKDILWFEIDNIEEIEKEINNFLN